MLALLALVEVEQKLSFAGLTVTESTDLNCTTDALNQPSEMPSIIANSKNITLRQYLSRGHPYYCLYSEHVGRRTSS